MNGSGKDPGSESGARRDVWRALAMVSQIGIGMFVPIFLCLLIGRWLDEKLGTGCFLIIFLLLGIGAAYRNLFASVRPLIKSRRPETEADRIRRKAFGEAVPGPEEGEDGDEA